MSGFRNSSNGISPITGSANRRLPSRRRLSDTATVYPAFDIHLLLSQREGFGLVTAEAMSCGVPAVGTDIPGTRDILQGNKGGLLVPLDGMAEIVESIGRLISNPGSLTPMGLNAREHIVQNFSQTRWMADTLDFYKDVLAAGRFRSAEI